MEAVNPAQGSDFNTAITEIEADDDQDRFEAGAYGELMRRAKRQPLDFSFAWRGRNFMGTVESLEDGMRLSLRGDLAAIPYSAENAAVRNDLLAVVDTCAGGGEASLMVVQGRRIMLEHEIALPRSLGDTMATIVTHLTILVLKSAPYLDLLAGFTAPPADA